MHRVEGEGQWNLCRAYNFAAARATGSILLKLDADSWLDPSLDVEQLLCQAPIWLGSGSGGKAGQWLMNRDAFAVVGGFNERMLGWGFDDKDLRARLVVQFGAQVKTLPPVRFRPSITAILCGLVVAWASRSGRLRVTRLSRLSVPLG